MRTTRLLATATLLVTSSAMASDFGVSLAEDSMRGVFNYAVSSQPINFGLGYTHHDGSRNMADLSLHATGQTALLNMPTTVGIGGMIMGFDDEDTDTNGGGVGFGGFVRMNIPKVPGLGFNAAAHYAPTITSFGDADGMTNFETSLSYRVIKNAEVSAGYRFYETDFDPSGELTLDEGGFLGMRLFF